MDWPAWAPTYRAILDDFGYSEAEDEAARDELARLAEPHLLADLDALRARFAGRDVVVVGAAATADDVARIPVAPLLVSDGAAEAALPMRRADAVVTDLDGDASPGAAASASAGAAGGNVAAQLIANALGTPLFVHAHGDNRAALRAHVPSMKGPIVATTQARPIGRVQNFGGFTDGDRACCLAAHLGAASLTLVGFDFATPVPKPGRDTDVKARKLAWARRVIDGLGLPVRVA